MKLKNLTGLALGVISLTASLASSAAVCDYVLDSDWNTGFTARVIITNNTNTTIKGWSLGWQYNANRITHFYNADISGSSPYVASALSWNSEIKPGQKVSFGFNGAKNGGPAERPQFTGSLCGGDVSSASSASLSSSSRPACVSQCNWSGKLYPLCTQADSGWGWENNANCISRAACSGLSAPLGVVTACAAGDASSAPSSQSASSASEHPSSISYSTSSDYYPPSSRSSSVQSMIYNTSSDYFTISSRSSSVQSKSYSTSSDYYPLSSRSSSTQSMIYNTSSDYYINSSVRSSTPATLPSSAIASSVAPGAITREQASNLLEGTFHKVVNGVDLTPGGTVINGTAYDWVVRANFVVNGLLSRKFNGDGLSVLENGCNSSGVVNTSLLLPETNACAGEKLVSYSYAKISDTHIQQTDYCDSVLRTTTDYYKLSDSGEFDAGSMSFFAPGYESLATDNGVCGSTYQFNINVDSNLPLPPELAGLKQVEKNQFVYITTGAPYGNRNLSISFRLWGIITAADVTQGDYHFIQGFGVKGDFAADVSISEEAVGIQSLNIVGGTLSVSSYSPTSFSAAYRLETDTGDIVEGTTAFSIE